MSRCFQYPPPGYVRDGIRDEALIESIKLQREGEKAKKERKNEKKHKKRQKEKAWGSGDVESKKRSHKKRQKGERSREDDKGGDLQKRTKKETEQLEKSCLTEERGHPVGSQTSSDSTLNSNKIQKLSSPLDGRLNSGSIIRIRLPSQRHKDSEVLPVKEQPCTAPGRTDDAFIQLTHEPAPRLDKEVVEYSCSTSRKVGPEFAVQPSKENPCRFTRVTENSSQKPKKPCLSPGVIEGSAQTAEKLCLSSGVIKNFPKKPCLCTRAFASCAQLAETSVPSNLCGRCPPQLASKFRDVIEKWVPIPVQRDYTDFDDQEWLFETKHNKRIGATECELADVGLSHENSATWPHVCYLSEADVYALPFTVPF